VWLIQAAIAVTFVTQRYFAMTPPPLDQAIQHYAQAIAILTADPPLQLTPTEVLTLLSARDVVRAALAEISQPRGADLERIHHLDGVLKTHAGAITQVQKTASASISWQDSFKPDETAWWWFLEQPPTESLPWLWSAISIACLTASLTLIGDIAPRLITGSPDLLSSFFVTVQGAGGLASAGAILKAIEATAKRAGDRSVPPFKRLSWQKLSAGISVLLLVTVSGLRLSLPYFSDRYTTWGLENYGQGNWSSAKEDYERALKLNPDNAQAHFRLGVLYEDLQNTDAARTQYQLAMQGDVISAINNLARLHILNGKYSAAVVLLLKALDSEQQKSLDPPTKHAVLKNLGWARLKQTDYPGAEAYLLEAIDLQKTAKLDQNIAAPHCLLAQVMEAQKQKQAALDEWERCNKNANSFNPDEDGWVITAQKRLAAKESGK
jgi:tetratricopeptide (TPR) repeat protein